MSACRNTRCADPENCLCKRCGPFGDGDDGCLCPRPYDPLKPSTSLLMKMGSAIVHAEEYLGADPSPLDKEAFVSLLADPEFKQWREEMEKRALLPVPRNR